MITNFLTVLALGLSALPALADAARPNVIVIMADDMGFSDIGCYGGEIHTPNLDRMAKEGMRFTQFYNNAKCTTTRAALLSGMYPRGNGSSIPLDMPTIGEAMRAQGYRTALCGKWHLGSKAPQRPHDRGFDFYYGLMDGCCNFFNPAQPDPEAKGNKVRVFGEDDRLITEFPEGFYTTDAFTDRAISAVKDSAQAKTPFFLHLAYTAPHYPLHAPPEDIAKYRGKYRMGWEEMRKQRYQRQQDLHLFSAQPALSETDSQAYAWGGANQEWEDLRMATYAAMVDRMDQNIGRLLKALDEAGVADNTLILFFSDNGGCTEEPGGRDPSQQPGIASTYTAVGPSWGWAQNTPFRRYKSWVNEGGISHADDRALARQDRPRQPLRCGRAHSRCNADVPGTRRGEGRIEGRRKDRASARRTHADAAAARDRCCGTRGRSMLGMVRQRSHPSRKLEAGVGQAEPREGMASFRSRK